MNGFRNLKLLIEANLIERETETYVSFCILYLSFHIQVWGVGILYVVAFPVLLVMLVVGAIRVSWLYLSSRFLF